MNLSFLLRRKVIFGLMAGCISIVILFGLWAIVFDLSVVGDARPVAVTLSKKTTYITEPLRADGSVDYLAAINQRCSEGVTLENNASVLIWQALGPEPHPAATRAKFFELLGIPLPSKEGDYFVSLEQYARKKCETDDSTEVATKNQARQVEEIELQLDAATTRPWTKNEFPVLADWLEANEKPLALVIQATHRSHRYDPLVADPNEPNQVMSADLSMVESRSLAGALIARSMLRVSEGRFAEAWQDLLATHNLSRLVAEGPMLVEELVGIAINEKACAGERAFLQYVELSREQATRMLDDLNKLLPLDNMVDKLDAGERFSCLDNIFSVAHEMSGNLIFGKQIDPYLQKLAKLSGKSKIDWDLIFTNVNSWWDRQIAACRLPTRPMRDAAIVEMDDELRKRAEDAKGITQSIRAVLDSRRVVSENMATVFLALLLPAASAACDAELRAQMDLDLTKLAFALAGYRADHTSYPERLSNLVPQYIAKVPDDIFVDAPLRYIVKDDGYLLQSVGHDGEGVEVPADGKEHEEVWSDDLIVRMHPLLPRRGR